MLPNTYLLKLLFGNNTFFHQFASSLVQLVFHLLYNTNDSIIHYDKNHPMPLMHVHLRQYYRCDHQLPLVLNLLPFSDSYNRYSRHPPEFPDTDCHHSVHNTNCHLSKSSLVSEPECHFHPPDNIFLLSLPHHLPLIFPMN